jgi:hypothetical protein
MLFWRVSDLVKKNLLTMDILEGIERSDGCPLCYLWTKSEERLLRHLLTNEVVMDPDFRKKVTAAKGFCNRHMHLLYRTAYSGRTENGRGYARYMQGVVEKIVEQIAPLTADLEGIELADSKIFFLKRKQKLSLLDSKIKHATRGQKPCPACESLWSLDRIHLHTLVQMLEDKEFRKEFKSSRGLCLPHFLSAMQMLNRAKFENPLIVARTLIETEIKSLKLVGSYLSEFVRKSSWNFRKEPRGPEINANHMVLILLAGTEGLYQVHKKDIFEETTGS